jgi:hypothetical protein
MSTAAINPRKFSLIMGNARSGTTIVGSIVDSHPRMICANESAASATFWRDLNRDQIIAEIVGNSAANYTAGRPSSGYQYRIETAQKREADIEIVADKIWNPAMLLLAGDRRLIATLSDRMQCPVVLVHCVRNPFDVIATMHRRSGASLSDRIRWYAMHCEAAQILIERDDTPIHLLRHEDLMASPEETSVELFRFLGDRLSAEQGTAIRQRVFSEPRRTHAEIAWSADLVDKVDELIGRFEFLKGYKLSSGDVLRAHGEVG